MMCPHCNKEIIPNLNEMILEQITSEIRKELKMKHRKAPMFNKREYREALKTIYEMKKEISDLKGQSCINQPSLGETNEIE